MRIALVSDIHANREALAAVLSDLRQHAIDRIAVLGDVVGYGPDPVWCASRVFRLVEEEGAVCLRGNHDAAMAGRDGSMNPVAAAALDWTAAQLDPETRARLATLPMTAALEGALLVHASPMAPADWIYITSETMARAAFSVTPERVIFCGHVHVPQLYARRPDTVVTGHEAAQGRPLPLIPSRRWLAVIGSVGQPRDGVAQAGWAIWDTGAATLTFRRTPYDTAATAAKIRAAGLPEPLARRILTGE